MKTPTTTEVMTSEALAGGSILAGTLPPKLDSLAAEVLVHLLRRDRMTGLEAVFDAGTTRLSARIHYLAKKYGWPVQTSPKVASCKDGRIAHIVEYFLLPSTIADAMSKGAAAWCAEVRAARLKLRSKAAEAKRRADAINAAHKKRRDDRQADLFGGPAA